MLPQGAPKAIRRPNGDHVEVAPDYGLEQSVELRALIAAFGAANALVLMGGDVEGTQINPCRSPLLSVL
jgi:hypothetical protein